MSGLKQGEVLLTGQLDCHKGRLTALEGQQLVLLFLGTTRIGQIPGVSDFMEVCGWRKEECYEVQASLCYASEPGIPNVGRRTIFRAENARAAAESATRFARRQAMELDAGAVVSAISLSVVKLGPVLEDGTAHHVRGATVLEWNWNKKDTLDEAVAKVE